MIACHFNNNWNAEWHLIIPQYLSALSQNPPSPWSFLSVLHTFQKKDYFYLLNSLGPLFMLFDMYELPFGLPQRCFPRLRWQIKISFTKGIIKNNNTTRKNLRALKKIWCIKSFWLTLNLISFFLARSCPCTSKEARWFWQKWQHLRWGKTELKSWTFSFNLII